MGNKTKIFQSYAKLKAISSEKAIYINTKKLNSVITIIIL